MSNIDNILHVYISGLFLLKLLLIGIIVREYLLKLGNTMHPNEIYVDKIKRDEIIKNTIENIFLFCIYLLIMYLFYPYNKVNLIHVDDHTKMLLFATGFISIAHMFSKK